jgi:hypothetical protein
LLFDLDGLVLADTFDTETAFRTECRNISFDRVADAPAVVLLPELRHESLPLNLAHDSIRQITLKVTTDLREVLAILNGDYQ